jgi:hypothetical protein
MTRTRWLTLLLGVLALLVTTPGVASAHVLKGQYANNYATTVTSVAPNVPQLVASATADGASVSITYTGTETVTIFGYFHEPYLRITTAGVDENTNSPSVDLNQTQNISNLGDGSDINKTPQWKHISDVKVATWHDHRVHWMGSDPPPVAQKDPGHSHLIDSWKLDLTVGATPVVVNGTLTWLPWTPASKLPLIIAIAVTVAVLAAIVVLVRRRRQRHHATESTAEPVPTG